MFINIVIMTLLISLIYYELVQNHLNELTVILKWNIIPPAIRNKAVILELFFDELVCLIF